MKRSQKFLFIALLGLQPFLAHGADYFGFDQNKGALCHFHNVVSTTDATGVHHLRFSLDASSGLQKDQANYVADELTREYKMDGTLEDSANPKELTLKASYPGKPFSYDCIISLNRDTKEIVHFEEYSSYHGLLEKLHVEEYNCKNVASAKKLQANSPMQALQKFFPKAIDAPNCLTMAKSFQMPKQKQDKQDALTWGAASIALGFSYPPVAAYTIPIGMLIVGVDGFIRRSSNDPVFAEKNHDTAQALHQAYLYNQSENAVFNFPMLSALTKKLQSDGYDIKLKDLVKILKQANESKELCLATNVETKELLYQPKSVAELEQFIKSKLPMSNGTASLEAVSSALDSASAL